MDTPRSFTTEQDELTSMSQETTSSETNENTLPPDEDYSSLPQQDTEDSSTNGSSKLVYSTEPSHYDWGSQIETPLDEFADLAVQPSEPLHDQQLKELTVQKMLDYILSHDATVPVCLCLAIVSGLPQCGKTISLKKMLHNSIELKHRKHFSPFLDQPMQFKVNEESLSSYDLCVLGTSPLETLAWMFSTKRYGVTMCLLSYFVRLCTHRNIPCDQLQFTSSPTTIPDPLLNEHVKWLFEKLQQRWKTVAKEAPKRFVLQTGICLLNVFDVKQCTNSFHFLIDTVRVQ